MPCPGDPGARPPFIAVPNTARLVMRYNAFGQTIENVHFFTRDGGYGSGELSDLAAAANVSWQANIKPLLPAAITLVDITATDQEVVSGAQATLAVSSPGTNAAAAFDTTGNTFAIKFATGLSGRSYRGRMYWPLLNAPSVNDGQIVNAAVAAQMVAAVGDFFGDILADSGDQHVVVSYQNDCEWRDDGVPTAVTAYSYTDLYLDSQRRRLPGRGI